MLIDTNIFIDFFKGNLLAKKFFTEKENLSTSILVLMEIITGLGKKNEIKQLTTFLESGRIKVYHLDEFISNRAYQIFIDYHWSQGMSIPDSLIAATAIAKEDLLATLNTKHFSKIKGLDLVKPY